MTEVSVKTKPEAAKRRKSKEQLIALERDRNIFTHDRIRFVDVMSHELRNSKPAYWKPAVSDGGPGLAPDRIRNVAAFRQHWSGSAELPPGVGLGLVLVQSLARLHSGETLIENQSSSGARVSVMIPVEC
jgi:signal transduction histidine kinase